jgi:polar amino acid transport system substrate-binding protein
VTRRTLPAAALAAAILCSPLVAQEKPPLRWGTDPTGGAPYVFQDNDGKYVGFEVELAEYLAAKLGRKSEMVEGNWPNLPNQLEKPADVEKGIDVVLNGYELRKDLTEKYAPTRPYYIYRLVLVANASADGFTGWSDLLPNPNRKKQTVCVLNGSVAHRYTGKTFGDGIDLSTNDDVANVFKLVADGRLDATVQDNPSATYFVKADPKLKTVGDPVRSGFYVIYYRKSDPELGKQIDKAIADGLRDGTLKKIYQKYGLWNDDQERLWYWLDQPWPPPDLEDEPDVEDVAKGSPWPRLWRELVVAAGMTVLLAVVSFPLAVLLGLAVAVVRTYGPKFVSIPAGIYVEVIRGTPLLLQLFLIYYLVPELLFSAKIPWLTALAREITPFVAGVLGLAINYSAYEAENYRAGLQAVPHGQTEAALSLGMTKWTTVRRIVVPQAVRIVIPPVTNDFIALFKDTAACSTILVVELTRKYNELFNFNRGLIIELAFITAGLYLLMSYPMSLAARYLERRLGTVHPGAKP